MSKSVEVQNNGIGFVGLLTIIFVIAKLTGHLDWTWWWVFSPVLFSWAFVLVVLTVSGVVWLVVELLDERKRRKRARLAQMRRAS